MEPKYGLTKLRPHPGNSTMSRASGFTLIELMITVAVIAIIAAVALPSYSQHVMRANITEAVSGLSDMRVKLEQYFQDQRTYNGAPAPCNAGTVAPLPVAKHFTFACSNLGALTYTVTATGSGSMANFTYTINQAGTKTSTVPAGWANQGCGWVLKKDGSC
jgi:type IV pilus assembly protein PilE